MNGIRFSSFKLILKNSIGGEFELIKEREKGIDGKQRYSLTEFAQLTRNSERGNTDLLADVLCLDNSE